VRGRPFTKETAPRTGGKPGRTQRKTRLRTNAELIAAGKDVTPLEVLQGFSADIELDEGLRITAANAAARYVHKPMPQAVEHSGTVRLRHTFAEAVLSDEDAPPDEGAST
jgi:hypothetical protein